METKTVKIEAPEGYEVDNEKSTFQQIIFKKIEKTLPMNWKELGTVSGFYISEGSLMKAWTGDANWENRNLFPSREEAEAMLAMAQLCQLRDAWNNGWKANYTEGIKKYCIANRSITLIKDSSYAINYPMVFETEKLRDEFFYTFKDLLEIAKPFL